MSEVRVAGLNVYPIKSCAAVEISSAEIAPNGLAEDRKFMLVNRLNNMLTLRQRPELVHVRPSFGVYSGDIIGGSRNGILNVDIEGHGRLVVDKAGRNPDNREHDGVSLFLPPHHEDKLLEASVHGNKVTGTMVSGEANEFFSDFLGTHVKLLRIVESSPRQISAKRRIEGASNQTGFADAYPMLLTSQASLDELNRHPEIADMYPEGVPMGRFRPNIVVEGDGLEAYDEDYWRQIRIGGGVVAYVVKPCVRCQIPDTDQRTGRVGKEVRRALAAMRRGVENGGDAKGIFFGQNLNHVYKFGASIAVGDLVEVIDRADEPNVLLG